MSQESSQKEMCAQILKTTSPIMIDLASEKKCARVLHVDDDPCLLEITKQILSTENNFEIDTVTSVDEAFKKMNTKTYDAIVSDYEMPLKNGLDFLKELREQQNGIPFILFTGKGREEVVVKALNLGADRYLSKIGSIETVYCELADAINKTVSRKNAEDIVRKSEERYRELANSLPETVFEADLTGRITFLSQRAFGIIGLTREDLKKGLNMLSFVVTEEREKAKENLKKAFSGEKRGDNEYKLCKKDGITLPVLVRTNPIISENKVTGLRGLVIDITERKNAEDIVRKSEERYRELANSVTEMVFESDLTGKITYISQRAMAFTGYTNEELEGRNILDFLVPEDRKRAIENMKRSFTGENLSNSEYSLFRKNGTTYPTLVRTSRIISENKVVGLRGLVIEISELKKVEKALQESENHYRLLAEREHMTNEKLNVIGKLTRHDVRNKLSTVKANAYLLKKRVGGNLEIANCIAAIEQSVEQTESLLEFSRIYEQIGTEQLRTVDVEECFNEAASFFPDLQKIKVTNECKGFSVTADSLLRQLFYNFIDNSLKYGEKISEIRLHYMREENQTKLCYEDNGVGILEANKPRTFSEGFTTGKGTGHGLYLVKKMMEVYGWNIEEIGEEGKGVKFVIAIPESK